MRSFLSARHACGILRAPMSRESVELVRGVMDGFFSGDIASVFSAFGPAIEFRPPPEHPDFGVYHGHDEVRRAFSRWIGAWEALRYDPPDYVDAGDRVLAVSRQRGRAKGSGIEVETEFAILFEIHDGRIVRFDMFFDRGEAVEAAGLRE